MMYPAGNGSVSLKHQYVQRPFNPATYYGPVGTLTGGSGEKIYPRYGGWYF